MPTWTTVDFDRRASPRALPELMDEPCGYEEFRDCLRSLTQVNRLTWSYRPTLRWLARVAARTRTAQPLRILDVGSGAGDMLRRVERWAGGRKLNVELTGADLNPYAARAAREFTPPVSRIRWVTANALTLTSADAAPDIILSSLFTHHLEDGELVQFLVWMEETARLGWFINDLHRSRDATRGFQLLAWILHWHRFVKHDGPVSFRRAFHREDWLGYLKDAGIPAGAVRIERVQPARLCLGRVKPASRIEP